MADLTYIAMDGTIRLTPKGQTVLHQAIDDGVRAMIERLDRANRPTANQFVEQVQEALIGPGRA